MKIISYSLWGDNLKYTIGALKNAELAIKFYPGWICRFYCDKTVPKNILEKLKLFPNTQIIENNIKGDWKFAINRFLPMSEDIDLMISRDTDSRFSERETSAVAAWIESGKSAHIMRDHPYHGGFPMLAGMFGIKGGIIKNIKALFSLMHPIQEQYHYDQILLANFIYPYIEKDVIIHDEYFSQNPYPVKRKNMQFVGQAYDENDIPCNPEHCKLL